MTGDVPLIEDGGASATNTDANDGVTPSDGPSVQVHLSGGETITLDQDDLLLYLVFVQTLMFAYLTIDAYRNQA